MEKEATSKDEYSKKEPSAGGVNYEVLLNSTFALSGLQLFKDNEWKLSAQNKLPVEKWDDLIFEFKDEVILLLAKFRLNKTALCDKDFLSEKGDCSLQTLSVCFNKVKENFKQLQIKYCILCSPNKNSSLLFKNVDAKEDHKMLQMIFGDCENKIFAISKEKEQLSKIRDIVDRSFISTFLYIQMSEEQIKAQIEKKLIMLSVPSSSQGNVINYVQNWYSKSKHTPKYMTSNLIKSFLKKEYEKKTSPTGGVNYEVLLNTIFALSGLQLFEDNNWKLSTQDKLGGEKWDDLIFEFNEEVIMLQAKFKLHKTTLRDNDFLCKKGDYSLETYSLCFNETKKKFENSRVKYCILCSPNKISSLLFDKVDVKGDYKMLQMIFGDCENKIFAISKKGKQPLSEIRGFADDSFISVFLYIQMSEEQIKTQIKKKINMLAFPSSTHENVFYRVQSWYNTSKLTNEYMTSNLIKSFLVKEGSEILIREYFKQPIHFKEYYKFGDYEIIFIKGRPDWYLPKILKGIRTEYKCDDEFYNNVIVVRRSSPVLNKILKYFEYAPVKYLIVFTNMTGEQINQSIKTFHEITKNTCSEKKIVIVGEDLCFVKNDSIKLIQENIFETIDVKTIRKFILKNEGSVNNEKTVKPFYITRSIIVKEQVVSENSLLENTSKQTVILTGSQKVGKSSLLKKLSNDWIEKNPSRWIINLEMQNILKYLNNQRNSSFFNFLCDAGNINISTEIEMGLMQSLEKIILIDAITEHDWWSIKQLKNIIEENKNLNISKVVLVVTSYEGLDKSLRSFENIEVVTVKPLSKKCQLNVFENYLKDQEVEDMYVIAAKTIFEKLLSTSEIKLFCSSPLRLKILLEVMIGLMNEPELLTNALDEKLRGIDIYKYLADINKTYFTNPHSQQFWKIINKTNEYYSKQAENISEQIKLLIVIFTTDATTTNVFGNWSSDYLKSEIALKALKYINTTRDGLSMFDENGNALVHIAALQNSIHILKYLVEDCGMKLDEPNKLGDNPIQIATDNDCLDAVKYLKLYVDCHKVLDNNKNTLVHRAAWHNSVKVLKYLIEDCRMSPEQSNKYESTPLQVATEFDSVDCVKYLNLQVDLTNVDNNRNTLVHIAAWKNAHNVLKFLIEECNMSTNECNIFGNSPIQVATDYDSLECVVYLKAHVDLGKVLDNNNNTLVHSAAWHNAVKVLKYLIEYCGMSSTKLNKYGNSPLQVATDHDALDAVKYLHIDLARILDDNGNTLVHRAAWHNSVDVLKYLIENCRMNPKIPNKFGNTPMQVASELDNSEAIEYLNEHV